MASYDYICKDGHKTELWLRSLKEKKPKTIKCQTCNKTAKYSISAPKTFIWDCKDFH